MTISREYIKNDFCEINQLVYMGRFTSTSDHPTCSKISATKINVQDFKLFVYVYERNVTF